MSATSKEIRRWLNNPQMIALMSDIRVLAIKAGRRLGKTEEILAERMLKILMLLIGSSGFMAARTYGKLMDDLLPGLIAGWAKRGLVLGEDYVIGKTPPKHFKRPIHPPLTYDHYLSCSWGSGCHLVSFDHGATASNGKTTDFGVLDEVKQIDPVRFDTELLKTMSGHGTMPVAAGSKLKWRELPQHQSLTFVTDAFIGKNDFDWIGRYKDLSISMDDVLFLCAMIQDYQDTGDETLLPIIREIQCKSVLYLEASTEENLAALGIDYFESQFKSSTNLDFRISLLNENLLQTEGAWYQFLDETVHTYEARENNRIDTIGITEYLQGKNKNCLLDKDWRSELSINVNIDYGSTHCWFVVKQVYANTYWTLINFWTTNQQIEDGVDMVCSYFKPHIKKVVNIYDDPGGHKKQTDQTVDKDKVIARFRKHGWAVVHKTPANMYIPHKIKFRIMQYVLDERPGKHNPKWPKARFNIGNAYQTFYSCSKARIKKSSTEEYSKDKGDEKNPNIEQWKTTHLSDAFDMDICFDNLHLLGLDPKFSF